MCGFKKNFSQALDHRSASLVASDHQLSRSFVAHFQLSKRPPPRLARRNFIVSTRNLEISLKHGSRPEQVEVGIWIVLRNAIQDIQNRGSVHRNRDGNPHRSKILRRPKANSHGSQGKDHNQPPRANSACSAGLTAHDLKRCRSCTSRNSRPTRYQALRTPECS